MIDENILVLIDGMMEKYINFIGRLLLDLLNIFEELKYLKIVCFIIFLLEFICVYDLWKILMKMNVKC